MEKESKNIRLVYAVLLGGFLFPVFITVSQYLVTLITDDGKDYILLKAFVGVFYAIYIYLIHKFFYKKK
jgi:hypothetical protein